MGAFLIHLLVTAGLLLLVAKIVDGVDVDGLGSALFAALILGLVNGLVRPLAVFLSLPLTIITFGLFLLVINALMLWLAAAIVPGFKVRGFAPAFWGAALLTLFNWGIDRIFS
jgi:putative membrane protein